MTQQGKVSYHFPLAGKDSKERSGWKAVYYLNVVDQRGCEQQEQLQPRGWLASAVREDKGGRLCTIWMWLSKEGVSSKDSYNLAAGWREGLVGSCAGWEKKGA